jgi:phenylacetate-coenzyme A ligase PaaK-like adenylate-forming protein
VDQTSSSPCGNKLQRYTFQSYLNYSLRFILTSKMKFKNLYLCKQMVNIFDITTTAQFEWAALDLFHYQLKNNELYAHYVKLLGKDPNQVNSLYEIPFLPISFFKSQSVRSFRDTPEMIFYSSGTTGIEPSKHEVKDLELYRQSFRQGFKEAYGELDQVALLALLPSYAERSGSSLIYMVDDLLQQSLAPWSGYFLYNHQELADRLHALKLRKIPTILIGVSFALLDFTDQYRVDFPELTVIETGGMKGKRKEMIREELHHLLKNRFGVSHIHSEYGMTELLSQAYMHDQGRFAPPAWMRILIRDPNDPFHFLNYGQSGGINVIDLANRYSCAFIATQDLGKVYPNGQFDVLGRFDDSDIRGCNLLIQ